MSTASPIQTNVSIDPAQSWTHRLGAAGTGLVDYHDSTSAEFFEVEREAVFRRSWLMVGRNNLLQEPGSYFTKELEVLKTSVLIVRGKDDKIRGFHNVCPHRGNRLAWHDHPRKEEQGQCLLFRCKYHGLGYDTTGTVRVLTDAENWFGDEGRSLRLSEIPTETWNGFVFVNLTPGGPKQSLREHLGEFYWNGFDDYPFARLTNHFAMRGTSKSNWKILADAFAEAFHVFTLHAASFGSSFTTNYGDSAKFRALDYSFHGKHRSTLSARIPEGLYSYRLDRAAQATGAGPRYPMSIDLTQLPKAANPVDSDRWGTSIHGMWPNWMFQIYYPGWFLTYTYWPLAYNEMRFEIDWYLAPPQNFSELWSQKVSMNLFMDTALQDINTLEATQLGLESNAVTRYPLTDEEILVRHLHKMIQDEVASYPQARPAQEHPPK
jgi:glycine betaine catabolism A